MARDSKQTKKTPAPTPTPSSPPADTPVNDGSAVVRLLERPFDIVYSAMYMSFFVLALIHFSGYVVQAAPMLAKFNKISQELKEAWDKEVFLQKDATLSLLRDIEAYMNVALAPCFALVMLMGAKKNNFKNLMVSHLAVMLLINGVFLFEGRMKHNKSTCTVFHLAYGYLVVAPLAIFLRIRFDWPFSYATLKSVCKSSGFLCTLYKLALFVGCVVALVFCYEWAIKTHKELKHLSPVTPHVQQMYDTTMPIVNEYSKAAMDTMGESLASVGKKLLDVSKDLMDKKN